MRQAHSNISIALSVILAISVSPSYARVRDNGVPIHACVTPSRPFNPPNSTLPSFPPIVCVQTTNPPPDGPWNSNWRKFTGPEVNLNGGGVAVNLDRPNSARPKTVYFDLKYADPKVRAIVTTYNRIVSRWNSGWVPSTGDVDEWGRLVGMEPHTLGVPDIERKIGLSSQSDIDFKFLESVDNQLSRLFYDVGQAVSRNPSTGQFVPMRSYGKWVGSRNGAWSPDLPSQYENWQAYFAQAPISRNYWGL